MGRGTAIMSHLPARSILSSFSTIPHPLFRLLCCNYNQKRGWYTDSINAGVIVISVFCGGFDMALIKCPECGKEVSNRASACIHCGCPLDEQPVASTPKKDIIPSQKEYSEVKFPSINLVQDVTGLGLAEAMAFVEQDEPVVKDGLSQEQAEAIAQKFQAIGVDAKICDSSTPLSSDQNGESNPILSTSPETQVLRCPKCGSTSIQAMKKGFGLGKAAIGGLLLGPVGLLGGAIGCNNVKRVCLNCRYEF